jgi:aminoglycoside phosphotransferase (APT) family kinase protein
VSALDDTALRRLHAWLSDRVDVAGPLEGEPILGGRSNLTDRVTDGVHRWVLRRPPSRGAGAGAHDVLRECTALAALSDSAVPVPQVVAHDDGSGPLGVPCYLMTEVAGATYRTAADLEALGADRTRDLGLEVARSLAVVHSVDVAAVGLASLGRADGFLARQIRTWHRQLDLTPDADLAARLVDELERRKPADDPGRLVHGDFRLDNLLIDDGQVTAVLDWEMATVGDPATDLALLLTYGRLPHVVDGPARALLPDTGLASGHPSEDELVTAYEEAGGRSIVPGFHLPLAHLKLAAIVAGVASRDRTTDLLGPAVTQLLHAGLDTLRPTTTP